MSQLQRIRIAIVGAGIAGLVLAVTLAAFDEEEKITIDLYDAVPELSEIGAGINIWPRTLDIFQKIGVAEALIPFFDQLPDLKPTTIFEVRKADQTNSFKIMDVITMGGALHIHRADLQRCLMQHLPTQHSDKTPCNLYLSHRLVDYTDNSTSLAATRTGPIILHFADKPSRTCDILVGADGIKSTIRPLFLQRLQDRERFGAFIDPVWSGAVAYRGLIPREELEKVFPGHRAMDCSAINYMGKNKHIIVYPVSGGKFINVVAVVHDLAKEGSTWEGPWNVEVTQREFIDQFLGWEEECQALMKCIKQPTRWALHHMDHLDTFAKGRVLLIGDAAHAMVPFQGAGASVGMDDAYVLASLLTHSLTPRMPSSQYIRHLTETYDRICVPHAINMSKRSIHQGHLYALQTPEFDQYKEGQPIPVDMLRDVFCSVEKNWLWTVTDPGENRSKATELLERIKSRL